MSKNYISDNGDITVPSAIPAVLSRPRCLVRHLASWPDMKYVARITAQVLMCSGFISGGLLAWRAAGLLNPIGAFGAFLAVMGVGLVFSEEDTQTPEEYREFVIAHFRERGETPPRWTQVVKRGQVWRHRITKRHYKVISIRNRYARCLVTDVHGGPIVASGKARFCEVKTFILRHAFQRSTYAKTERSTELTPKAHAEGSRRRLVGGAR